MTAYPRDAMEANQSNKRAGQVATKSRLLNRRGILPTGLVGFGVGVICATSYLLLGGEYFWNIPRWADIVFYPGFLAGRQAYHWGLSVPVSKVVGVLAVGFAYALLAVLLRFAWRIARERRAKRFSIGAMSPISKSRTLALLLLCAAVSAQAENPFHVPDHIWLLGIDSHHPVGVAWWNPTGARVNSSIEMVLCFGTQHGFEMRIPLFVLGPLMFGFFGALLFGLARRCKQRYPEKGRRAERLALWPTKPKIG
jgi:hypothetical protein